MRVKRLSEGRPVLARVRFACKLAGTPVVMTVAPVDEFRLGITLEGTDSAARTMTTPPLTAAELIGRQLSDREPDETFRETMVVAQAMERSVVK